MWPPGLGTVVAAASRSQFDAMYEEMCYAMCVETSAAFLRACELAGPQAVQSQNVLDTILDQGAEITRTSVACETLPGGVKRYNMIDCQELPRLWRGSGQEPDMLLLHTTTFGNIPYDSTFDYEEKVLMLNGQQLGEKAAAMAREGAAAVLVIGNRGLGVAFTGGRHDPVFVFDPHGWMGGAAYMSRLPNPTSLTGFIADYVERRSGIVVTLTFLLWLYPDGWNIEQESPELRVEVISAALRAISQPPDFVFLDQFSETVVSPALPVPMGALRADRFAAKSIRAILARGTAPSPKKKPDSGEHGLPAGRPKPPKRHTPRSQNPALLDSTEKLSNLSPVKVKKPNKGKKMSVIAEPPSAAARTEQRGPGDSLGALAERPPWRLQGVRAAADVIAVPAASALAGLPEKPSDKLRGVLKYLPEAPTGGLSLGSGNALWAAILGTRVASLTDRLLVFLVENGITIRKAESEVGFLLDPVLAALAHRPDRGAVASLIGDTRLNLFALVARKAALLRLTELRDDRVSAVLVHKVQQVSSAIVSDTKTISAKLGALVDEISSEHPADAYGTLEKELLAFSLEKTAVVERPDETTAPILELVERAAEIVDAIEKETRAKAEREDRARRADEKLLAFAHSVWDEIDDIAGDVTRGVDVGSSQASAAASLAKRERIDIPEPSSMPPREDYSELKILDDKAKANAQKITDSAGKMLKVYANVIDYSISAFTSGTQSAIGRFALASPALDHMKAWLDRIAYADTLVDSLAGLTGRRESASPDWGRLSSLEPVRILEGLIETGADLSSDENLNHWTFQLFGAHAAGFMPSPSKWISAIHGINTRAHEVGLSATALAELETEIKAAEAMVADPGVRLECAKHALESAKAAVAGKSDPEQKARLAAAQARAAKLVDSCQRDLDEAKRLVDEATKRDAEIKKAAAALLRPVEKYQGLRGLGRSMAAAGLSDDAVAGIVAADTQVARVLRADAEAILANYERDFAELRGAQLLGTSAPLLRAVNFIDPRSGLGLLEPGSRIFLSEANDDLMDAVEDARTTRNTDSCSRAISALERIKWVIVEAEGAGQWPKFAVAAARALEGLRAKALIDDRAGLVRTTLAGMLKRAAIVSETVAKDTDDPEAAAERALKFVEMARRELRELELTDAEELSSQDYVALERALVELAEASRQKSIGLKKHAWRSRLRTLLERDRDDGEFSLDAWDQARDEGECYGGRDAVNDDLIKLARAVIDGRIQLGLRLVRAFFANNPYAAQASQALPGDARGPVELLESIRVAKWIFAFPGVADTYEYLFGISVVKLKALCEIGEEIVEAFDAAGSSDKNIDMHAFVQTVAGKLFQVSELTEFFDFYVRSYELFLDIRAALAETAGRVGALERTALEQLGAEERAAESIRDPEAAKERLERGDRDPDALTAMRELHGGLKLESKKQFEKTAYLEPLEYGYAEARRELERAIANVDAAKKLSQARVKDFLSSLLREREANDQELSRNLKTLKSVLAARSPKDVVAALNGAETLDAVVKIYADRLAEAEAENEAAIVGAETMEWLKFAAKTIDGSKMARETGGVGPTAAYAERLEKLCRARADADAKLKRLKDLYESFELALASAKEAGGKQKDESEDGWRRYEAAANNLLTSAEALGAQLRDEGNEQAGIKLLLLREPAAAAYEKGLENAAAVIKDVRTTLDDTSAGMRRLLTLYEAAKTEFAKPGLERLQKEISYAIAKYPVPKWFLALHAAVGKLVELRLGLYHAYEGLKISTIPYAPVAPESEYVMPDAALTAARVTAYMARSGKSVMTVTTHSLGIVGRAVVDEANQILEYKLCYATVSEKVAALWAAGSRLGAGQFGGLVLRDARDERGVEKFLGRGHAAVSLAATAAWLSGADTMITAELGSYVTFCATGHWPAMRDRKQLSMTVAACTTYCALAYATLTSTYGSAADTAVDSHGQFVPPEKFEAANTSGAVAAGAARGAKRKFALSIQDVLILLAACEPAHLTYFCRLDLLRQVEYMHKTLEAVLSRAVRDRVGVSCLEPPKADDTRKYMPVVMPAARGRFDKSYGACFAIDRHDWDSVKAPHYVGKMLEPWKTLPGTRENAERLERICGGTADAADGFTATLMMLAATAIPANLLEAMWALLGPRDEDLGENWQLGEGEVEGQWSGGAASAAAAAMLRFMLRRAAAVDNYTVATSGGTAGLALDSLSAKLLGPAGGSIMFLLKEDAVNLRRLLAFDVALLSILFGAKVVIAYETSALSRESGLLLCSSVFDARRGNRFADILCADHRACASDSAAAAADALKKIALADPNRIENACLLQQVEELASALHSKPLSYAQPFLFLANTSNQITQVLIPAKARPSEFFVTLRRDAAYEEVPLRRADRQAFPDEIDAKDIEGGDLFFSATVGGEVPVLDNPAHIAPAPPEYDRGEGNLFPFAGSRRSAPSEEEALSKAAGSKRNQIDAHGQNISQPARAGNTKIERASGKNRKTENNVTEHQTAARGRAAAPPTETKTTEKRQKCPPRESPLSRDERAPHDGLSAGAAEPRPPRGDSDDDRHKHETPHGVSDKAAEPPAVPSAEPRGPSTELIGGNWKSLPKTKPRRTSSGLRRKHQASASVHKHRTHGSSDDDSEDGEATYGFGSCRGRQRRSTLGGKKRSGTDRTAEFLKKATCVDKLEKFSRSGESPKAQNGTADVACDRLGERGNELSPPRAPASSPPPPGKQADHGIDQREIVPPNAQYGITTVVDPRQVRLPSSDDGDPAEEEDARDVEEGEEDVAGQWDSNYDVCLPTYDTDHAAQEEKDFDLASNNGTGGALPAADHAISAINDWVIADTDASAGVGTDWSEEDEDAPAADDGRSTNVEVATHGYTSDDSAADDESKRARATRDSSPPQHYPASPLAPSTPSSLPTPADTDNDTAILELDRNSGGDTDSNDDHAPPTDTGDAPPLCSEGELTPSTDEECAVVQDDARKKQENSSHERKDDGVRWEIDLDSDQGDYSDASDDCKIPDGPRVAPEKDIKNKQLEKSESDSCGGQGDPSTEPQQPLWEVYSPYDNSDSDDKAGNRKDPKLDGAALDMRSSRLRADAKSITSYVNDINEAVRDGGSAAAEFFARSEQSCIDSEDDARHLDKSRATLASDLDDHQSDQPRESLAPLDPETRSKMYTSLAVTCRLILRGMRHAQDAASAGVAELLTETNRIKMMLN
ncbi:large tegument protein [Psittacid alphaherpesvirus 1]|uniref:Large tegument protein deneddylase n=1 Tax=Psittacid herpesvirus 1 (isolate Amazon parrot/-/97-0001/1997) TaxID=670426 RepID=LTP_PSHV1|nr:large tegument protein [Psittacid alphaherpesvirus 1]Q6UDJ5.1 RecName: Full=Large tegument protein deneddylase [Psittacid herpesvirus 1 Amazon parrot/1997]AAQ73715.1 large tegument protein [Psittacid alphaherpesvirus 1]